jgi:hypothetical protein
VNFSLVDDFHELILSKDLDTFFLLMLDLACGSVKVLITDHRSSHAVSCKNRAEGETLGFADLPYGTVPHRTVHVCIRYAYRYASVWQLKTVFVMIFTDMVG